MQTILKARVLLFLVLLICLIGLPVFAGGEKEGAAAGGTIRLAHQHPDTTDGLGEVLNQILLNYQSDHPNINLEVEAERGDALRDKIKIDLAANNLPDLFFYWGLSSLKPMVDAGMLLDVSEYIDESDAIDWSDWPEDAWKEHTFDGEQYWAIPAQMFKSYYLANRELFEEYNLDYPKTYEEFLNVSQVFADNGIIPMAVGSKGGNPSHFYFAEVWYQFGTQEYMNKVTKGEEPYDCQTTRKVAEFILDMAKNRVFPKDPIGSGDFGPPVALYNEEKAAMIIAQTWMVSDFEDDVVAKSDLLDFPRMPGSKYDPTEFTVGGYNNTWAVKQEKYHDSATHDAFVDLLDAVTSDAFYRGMAESGQSIPAKKVPIKEENVLPLYYKIYTFYLDEGTRNMHWAHMPDPYSQEVFSTTMDELWTQNVTPAEFGKKIQASIDKAFK